LPHPRCCNIPSVTVQINKNFLIEQFPFSTTANAFIICKMRRVSNWEPQQSGDVQVSLTTQPAQPVAGVKNAVLLIRFNNAF
jgi:hypothetical protein